jgi:hypothetical protein
LLEGCPRTCGIRKGNELPEVKSIEIPLLSPAATLVLPARPQAAGSLKDTNNVRTATAATGNIDRADGSGSSESTACGTGASAGAVASVTVGAFRA